MSIHQNLLQLKIKSYTFLRIIGQGNYSRVYEVFDQKSQQHYAAKVIPKHLMNTIHKFEAFLRSEIFILTKCRNENVISFKENLSTSKSIVIIMELCQGGMLRQYLQKKGRLSEDQATCFLKQILNGFKGLHEVNAIHRDINASNILLHQNICKIIDLGYSKKLEQGNLTNTIFGVSPTMAPQMLDQKSYDNKADIWSIGILFYQLIFGEYPYAGQSSLQLLKSIKNTSLNFNKIRVSQNVKDFINKCLKYDAKQRITWAQIYEHPLITQDRPIKYLSVSNIRSKIQQNKMYYCSSIFQSSIKQQSHLKDIQFSPQTKRKRQLDQLEPLQNIQMCYSMKIGGHEETRQHIQSQESFQSLIYDTTKSAINISTVFEQHRKRLKIEEKILEYQNLYLNYRNRIMFIFKYVIPHFAFFYEKLLKKVQHQTVAFLICKNAYLEMQQLSFNYKFNLNFLNLDLFWQQFIKSDKYFQFGQLIQTDKIIITLQLHQFLKHLQKKQLDPQLKQQLGIKKAYHIYWNDYINHIIQTYQLDLIKRLQNLTEKTKVKLILLIKGLEYYRKHQNDGDIQEGCKMIENINYSQEEIALYERSFQH